MAYNEIREGSKELKVLNIRTMADENLKADQQRGRIKIGCKLEEIRSAEGDQQAKVSGT
jgi:hypothetical protein